METALVTGGNKGIGREIVRRLAEAGLTVYLGARDVDLGKAAAVGIAGDVRVVRLDVTDEEQVSDAVGGIERLDVLVNNAGVAVEWGTPVAEVSADQLRRTYEVNVFGVVTVTRACAPLLRRSPDGRIVNVSSPLGSLTMLSDFDSVVANQKLLAYNSSKAALNAVTLMYAKELAPVRVNAVNPGLVATDLNGFAPSDGVRTVERGAELPVRLALGDGTTGRFLGDDDFTVDGVVPW